jgi:hypothetical protein
MAPGSSSLAVPCQRSGRTSAGEWEGAGQRCCIKCGSRRGSLRSNGSTSDWAVLTRHQRNEPLTEQPAARADREQTNRAATRSPAVAWTTMPEKPSRVQGLRDQRQLHPLRPRRSENGCVQRQCRLCDRQPPGGFDWRVWRHRDPLKTLIFFGFVLPNEPLGPSQPWFATAPTSHAAIAARCPAGSDVAPNF